MRIPRYPDLLELVRAELQRREDGVFVHKAEDVVAGSGVLYDSVVRIRRGAPHDPKYSTVKRLADYLLTKKG
jgi:predicted transcriptional regulator